MREDKRPHNFSLVLGSSRGVRLAHMESRILCRGHCSLLSRLENMLDRQVVSEVLVSSIGFLDFLWMPAACRVKCLSK